AASFLREISGFETKRFASDGDFACCHRSFGLFEKVTSGDAFQPLLADVESLDQVRVAVRVLCFQIIEQPAAPADEHEQTASRVMMSRVCVGMLGEVSDSLAQ